MLPREPSRAVAVSAGVLLFTLTGWVCPASAQPVRFGPYTFSSEAFFAQSATISLVTGRFDDAFRTRWGTPRAGVIGFRNAFADASALEGFSPYSSITNLRNVRSPVIPCRPPILEQVEYVEFLFGAGHRPYEAPGVDALVFDNRHRFPNYTVAVRTMTGTLTDHRRYPASGQVRAHVLDSYEVYAIEVDLADFGVAPGERVEAVRVIGDCRIDPWVEYDPVMAAAIDRSCAVDADCTEGTECHVGRCVSGLCAYPAAPAGTPCSGGVCDGELRPSCVECVDDGHCSAEAPRCDLETQTCVECLEPEDCAAAENACLLPECAPDATCRYERPRPAGAPCPDGVCTGTMRPACVACLDDDDCAAPRPRCDRTQTCVECLSDDDCGAAAPRCDTRARRCRECLADNDCPAGPCEAPICFGSGHCITEEIPGCRVDRETPDAGVVDRGASPEPREAPPAQGCGCRAASPPAARARSLPTWLVGGLLLFKLMRRARGPLLWSRPRWFTSVTRASSG